MLLLAAVFVVLCLVQGCGKRLIGSSMPEGGKPGRVSGESLVATARAQIGIKYKSGGATPKSGFDCSGLLVWTYRQHGVTLPRTAKEQASWGRRVAKNQLRPGDIVVFRISLRQGYHTGIYSGGGRFIHSPRAGSRVREESLSVDYWKKRFVSGRRLI